HAHRTTRPGVERRRERDVELPDERQRNKHKAERHKRITDMQDENDRFSARPPSRPAPEANGMQDAHRKKEQRRDRQLRQEGPEGERHHTAGKHHLIETTRRGGQACVAPSHEPVAREIRNNTPADDTDKNHDKRNRATQGEHWLTLRDDLDMKKNVSERQDREDNRDPDITLVLCRHHFAKHKRGERNKENAVCNGRGEIANLPCKQKSDAPHKPENEKRKKRHTLQWCAARPVGDSGKQETRDDGADIAEQELMRMPCCRDEA